jgi:hypothetical protein
MRKSFLLSGILLASVLALRCDGKPNDDDDDDDDAGESGESGQGGKGGGAGKGALPGGKGGVGGSAGSSLSMGGASGSVSAGSGGDPATGGTGSGGSPATGGSGGTGIAGDAGMAGEPAAGGTNGGTDGTGGTTGGTDGTGGTTGGTDGTGGTTGGTDGTGGTGGTGEAGSGGGAGAGTGGSGGTSCGTGEGLALTSEPGTAGVTGWIEGDNNCVGIQGAVQVGADLAGSTITLTETDGKICVSGYAARVVASDFDSYWGAMVTVQLNNPGTGAALPYNATTYGVDGFSFSIVGEAVPPEIRPTLIVSTSTIDQYCKRICAAGDQSMLLSQAHLDCWEGSAGATPSPTTLTTLRFSIPSVTTDDTLFDFCIEDLAAVTDNVSIGDPGECPEAPVDPLTSCVDRCTEYTPGAPCQCDSTCVSNDDCCEDFVDECVSEG